MSSELGTLVVVVLKARNLKDKHTLHKQDVFAQVALNGPQKRTAVDIRGGQHPVWDEEIRISVPRDPSEKNRFLEVSCWAKEHKTDDLLGQGKVDITDTLRTGEFDDWVKLETDGVYRGDVFLEMTFYANAPAPLNRRASKLEPKSRLARLTEPYKYPSPSSSSPPNSNKSSPGKGSNQLPQTSPKRNHLVPPSSRPSSRSSSASPKLRDDPLPPLPEGPNPLPASLAPNTGPTANAGTIKPKPPSILRPGNPKSSPTPLGPSRLGPLNEDRQPQSQAQPTAHSQRSTLPNPYAALGPISPALSPPLAQMSGRPNHYENPSGVSFPVAMIGNAQSPVYEPQYPNYPLQALAYQSPTSVAVSSGLPDPYLSARYQQPLPLPSGSSPPRQGLLRRDPAVEAAEIRRQVTLQEEQQRAKRKEQEEADAALARQLDLELNLGDMEEERTRSDGVHMPGGW